MSQRDEYIEKAKARLDQWNAEIDKLKAKADEAEADAKVRYQQQLQELRRHRDEAEKRIKDLQQAGDDAWMDLKTGFDKAWDSIGDAFERARARFR